VTPPSGSRTPEPEFVPLAQWREKPIEEMRAAARSFLETMRNRRTVRDFSVVGDPEVKRRIREEAEVEERAFYQGKAPKEWLDALAHLGTDENKPFLERAPWLIVIFAESYEVTPEGKKAKNYYVTESVGIATGMLITALHLAGLVTLTHTPSPMKFLNDLLGRPSNERPFLILVAGYPEADARVPAITKKPVEEIAIFVE
jgi:iodotyrosine deiodinase